MVCVKMFFKESLNLGIVTLILDDGLKTLDVTNTIQEGTGPPCFSDQLM